MRPLLDCKRLFFCGESLRMKYIECGWGNRWVLRTEVEHRDGSETEYRGWKGPVSVQSVYFRLWVGQTIFILDSKEGWKKQQKTQSRFKCVVGLVSN